MSSQNDAPSSSAAVTVTTSDSPILQLLTTLGMTREDLEKHTSQMRQFLDSENAQKIARAQANGELCGSSPEEMLAYLTEAASTQNASKKLSMPLATRSSHRETPTPSPSAAPSLRHSRSTSHISKSHFHHDDEPERPSERSGARRSRTMTRNRYRSHTGTSPSMRPKLSLDEVMQMRSSRSRRVSLSEESEESGDETLRDVFVKSTAGISTLRYKYPHPARTSQPSIDNKKRHYREYSPASSRSGNYYRDDLYNSVTPKTHSNARTPTRNSSSKAVSYYRHSYASRHHPPSSSPPASSPISSPSKRTYNFVSSPGPMSDPPDEFSEELPYALPPGPHSEEKPDFSYAALIGQAILATPDHALRLKDIYDYISTVYPYFKRDGHSHSQKWMNAIRQNLTNTPQFFKREHPSGKASKGALWCIADKDLPCFADGGYNRHALNPDSVQSQKAEKRKRKKEEKLREERAKKARLAQVVHTAYTYPYGVPQFPRAQFAATTVPAPLHPDITFPPLPPDHPNAHLVNLASTSSEDLDDGVIFPPLPAYSQTRIAQEQRLKELSEGASSSPPATPSRRSSEPPSEVPSSPVLAPPLSSDASTSSVPALTPNNSSSSPREAEEDSEEDEFAYFSEYLESETQSLPDDSTYAEEEEAATKEDKRKGKGKEDETLLYSSEPSEPSSPAMSRLAAQATRSPSTSLYASTGFLGYSVNRSSTPPNDLSVYLGGSHTLTPLGRRNLPSTPTRRRKASKETQDNLLGSEERPDFLKLVPKTPSRRADDATSGAGASNAPITPRKMFSPFIGFSPFRTPSRRSIFDAADPSRMLDDELEALAQAKHESPVGLFPRGKGLLYESPSMPSPGKWRPW